jgi:hypothetical protein
MVVHICVLVPMVARYLIPPAYRTVLVFPKWYDACIAFFVAFACITLIYSWVFALVGVSMNDKAMFNTGVHIWFAACAWLTLQMTITILVAIKQLIEVVDHIFPRRDPFFKDLTILKKRAIKFRVVTWSLGFTSFGMLFACAFLHFYHGVFAYRFALFWVLTIELIVFDVVIIWFTRSGYSSSSLSTPKSNVFVTSDTSDHSEASTPRAQPMSSFRGNGMATLTSEQASSALFGIRSQYSRRQPQVNVLHADTAEPQNNSSRKTDESFVDVAVV